MGGEGLSWHLYYTAIAGRKFRNSSRFGSKGRHRLEMTGLGRKPATAPQEFAQLLHVLSLPQLIPFVRQAQLRFDDKILNDEHIDLRTLTGLILSLDNAGKILKKLVMRLE